MATLKIQLLALADYVTQSIDNKLSVIGIFDFLRFQQLPATHSRMWIACTLVGKPNTKEQVIIKITSPKEKKLIDANINFDIGNNGKANVLFSLDNFPLEEAGFHTIVIEHEKKVLGTYEFEVIEGDNSQNVSKLLS
jgi:hypothetical protein